MLSKKKIVSSLAVVMMLGSLLSATIPAYAATNSTQSGGLFSGLIQFIAQKFGLDQNQVKSAVQGYHDTQKQNMQANMQTREKKRLDDLVSQGKITSAQETAIIAELAALQSKYNPANFKDLTADQKKQKFQDEQNEIKAWAQAQGIDVKYVLPGYGVKFGGRVRRFDRWGGNSVTPTPTP